MKILITGVSGFIGRALAEKLSAIEEYEIVGTTRAIDEGCFQKNIKYILFSELSGATDWKGALQGVDVVVHLAARAHVLQSDPQAEIKFRTVNVDGAVNLAEQALDAGVKRFIFISSIGVNGTRSTNTPLNESSEPAPNAAYSLSKYDAEHAIRNLIEKKSRMELVIIRPPLVYAAHAPGNFHRLLKLVALGIPLPFGLIENQRSIIALENLVDFIFTCIKHPAASNQLFLISDADDVSTVDIVQQLAHGMGRRVSLLPVPLVLIKTFTSVVGKQTIYCQLCESLVIDCKKALTTLNWKPVISSRDALKKAGRSFKSTLHKGQ